MIYKIIKHLLLVEVEEVKCPNDGLSILLALLNRAHFHHSINGLNYHDILRQLSHRFAICIAHFIFDLHFLAHGLLEIYLLGLFLFPLLFCLLPLC